MGLEEYIKLLPSRVNIGITGTRHGLPMIQHAMLTTTLRDIHKQLRSETVAFFHHGDCTGADDVGAHVAERLGFVTVAHPPIDPKWRAFHRSLYVMEPLEYRARNWNIVSQVRATEAGILIVVPRYNREQMRGSGTWMTYRMACRTGIRRVILWPSGLIVEEKGVPET